MRIYVAPGSGGQYTPIALSKECSIDVSCDIKEISSIASGRGKKFKAGRYSWSVLCSALIDDTDGTSLSLLRYLMSGKRLIFSTSIAEASKERRLNGYVYVANWKENAPLSGMANYSVTLTGSDALNVFGEDVPPLVE